VVKLELGTKRLSNKISLAARRFNAVANQPPKEVRASGAAETATLPFGGGLSEGNHAPAPVSAVKAASESI
jgi:hypothetical protein